MEPATQSSQDEIVLSRVIQAPPARVREAWKKPELFKQWWGPRSFTCPVARIDERVGGVTIACMRSPDGKEYWSKMTYREVTPTTLQWIDAFTDARGNDKTSSDYGMPDWPNEAPVTLSFVDEGGKTRLNLRHGGLSTATQKSRDDCKTGWEETLDKLAKLVAQN